jgi:hypothetical protein
MDIIINNFLYKIINHDDVFQQKARKIILFVCLLASLVPFGHFVFTIYLLSSQTNPNGTIIVNTQLYGVLMEAILFVLLLLVGFVLAKIFNYISDLFMNIYFFSMTALWLFMAIAMPAYHVRETCISISVVIAIACNKTKWMFIATLLLVQTFSIINDSLYKNQLFYISYIPIGVEKLIYLMGGVVCAFCAILGVHFQILAHDYQINLANDELEQMTETLLCLTSFQTKNALDIIETNKKKIRTDIYSILKSIIDLFNAIKQHVPPAVLKIYEDYSNSEESEESEESGESVENNRNDNISEKISESPIQTYIPMLIDIQSVSDGNTKSSPDLTPMQTPIHTPIVSRNLTPTPTPIINNPKNINMIAKIICDKLSYSQKNNVKIVVSTIELKNESESIVSEILQKISLKGGDTNTILGDQIVSTWNIVHNITLPYLKSCETLFAIKNLCKNNVTIYLDAGITNCTPIKNINDNYVYKTTKINYIPRNKRHINKIVASENFLHELNGKMQCFFFGTYNIDDNTINFFEDIKNINNNCDSKNNIITENITMDENIFNIKYLCYITKKIENNDDEWMYQLESADNAISEKSLKYIKNNDYHEWEKIRKNIFQT